MRTHCRACDGTDLHSVLDLGLLPLAGGFLASPDAFAEERRYPLEIYCCGSCGLVQVLNPVDADILFQDYSFSSSTIKPLVDHFAGYAQWISGRLKPKTVVEFGCNDGVLLAPLEKAGIKAIGVDVSKNITDLARSKGLDVITGYFNSDVARSIRERVGPVDVVTGSNAFAHNDHPEYILEAANLALSNDGYLCLEFMYAGDLLGQLQWDTLYHEHLTFYTLSALRIILERHGFHVLDAERLSMHGGSLRVCASRKRKPMEAGAQEILEYEHQKKLGELHTWQGIRTRIAPPNWHCPGRVPSLTAAAQHLGVWCRRESHDVGECMPNGLPRRSCGCIAVARRQVHARHAYSHRVSGTVPSRGSRLCIRHSLELR